MSHAGDDELTKVRTQMEYVVALIRPLQKTLGVDVVNQALTDWVHARIDQANASEGVTGFSDVSGGDGTVGVRRNATDLPPVDE